MLVLQDYILKPINALLYNYTENVWLVLFVYLSYVINFSGETYIVTLVTKYHTNKAELPLLIF